ncbi:15055_t:CDS:1, partial [Funneliformis geosporum]
NKKRNIPSKKIFDYDKMTEDKWDSFSNKVDALANGCYLRNLTNKSSFNQNKLNLYWDLLQECILKAAESNIPSHQSKGHHSMKRPPLLSKLYKKMKFLYKFKILVRDTSTNLVVSQKWSTSIDEFYTLLNEFNIPYVRLPP